MAKSWFGGNITCPSCGEVTVATAGGRAHASGRSDHQATIINPGMPSIDKGGNKGGISPYTTTEKNPRKKTSRG